MSLQRLVDLNADLAQVSDEDFIKENMERVCLSPPPHPFPLSSLSVLSMVVTLWRCLVCVCERVLIVYMCVAGAVYHPRLVLSRAPHELRNELVSSVTPTRGRG